LEAWHFVVNGLAHRVEMENKGMDQTGKQTGKHRVTTRLFSKTVEGISTVAPTLAVPTPKGSSTSQVPFWNLFL